MNKETCWYLVADFLDDHGKIKVSVWVDSLADINDADCLPYSIEDDREEFAIDLGNLDEVEEYLDGAVKESYKFFPQTAMDSEIYMNLLNFLMKKY